MIKSVKVYAVDDTSITLHCEEIVNGSNVNRSVKIIFAEEKTTVSIPSSGGAVPVNFMRAMILNIDNLRAYVIERKERMSDVANGVFKAIKD